MGARFQVTPAKRRLVENYLNLFPFVRWDRFVTWDWPTSALKDRTGLTVTGWIDREKDQKKDFISLDFYPNGHMDYMTSSAKYSLPIFKILNDGVGRGHQVCKRVEHFFRPRNVIKLKT